MSEDIKYLETIDNGAGPILVDCPLKRAKDDPGYLILVKGECNKCPFHKGIIKRGITGFDTTKKAFDDVTADEIHGVKYLVNCSYEKEVV